MAETPKIAEITTIEIAKEGHAQKAEAQKIEVLTIIAIEVHVPKAETPTIAEITTIETAKEVPVQKGAVPIIDGTTITEIAAIAKVGLN